MTECQAVLAAVSGDAMSLKGVTARGRINGLMLSMTVRQAYRNDTAETLETVYTFPLAWGAVLMGLSVEIAGRRLAGTVLPEQEAEARYESAIADGDSPIRVSRSADQLYTATLGNLKPGESAVIEIRYAQLLRVEQGRVRLSLPTTIAPRYGDARRDAGIPDPAAAGASLSAAYPFDLRLAIDGTLLKRARALAARRGLSVSAFLADELRALVAEDAAYASAERVAAGLLQDGLPLDGAGFPGRRH